MNGVIYFKLITGEDVIALCTSLAEEEKAEVMEVSEIDDFAGAVVIDYPMALERIITKTGPSIRYSLWGGFGESHRFILFPEHVIFRQPAAQSLAEHYTAIVESIANGTEHPSSESMPEANSSVVIH